MRINADFSRPAVMQTSGMDWVASPMRGVERKMLDRVGEEVARATSLVRYAPGSYFSEHTHGGGEEFLVLEGTFSDQSGDFPAGTYVRNPIGSKHTPHSEDGCVIFVKLHQFDKSDTQQKSVQLSLALSKGVQDLHRHGNEWVRMIALEDGERLDFNGSEGGVELLVLAGSIKAGGGSLATWDWLRLPVGEPIAITAEGSTKLYLKTGHLFSHD